MTKLISQTHNLAWVGLDAHYCVFKAKTQVRINPDTGEKTRIKLTEPKYYGMVVMAFGYVTPPDDEISAGWCSGDLVTRRLFGKNQTGVFGYSPSALRDGGKARWYFPESMWSTREGMIAELKKHGVDPLEQRYCPYADAMTTF